MQVTPLEDRILVLPDKAKTQTDSGLYLPESDRKSTTGTVVAVGPGRMTQTGTRVEPSVTVNDKVMFGEYDGSDIVIDGVDHKLIREIDLLAKFQD